MAVPPVEQKSPASAMSTLEQTSAIPLSEGAKKVYNIIAFMEIGLHPHRGNTKYRIDNFKLVPMTKSDYEYNLLFTTVNLQPLARTWFGANHDDVLSLSDELISFFRRYLWDPDTQDQAIEFLRIVLQPGFVSLQQTTYSNTSTSETVDNWNMLIELALKPPYSKEGLMQHISSSVVINTKFFQQVLTRLEDRDLEFGLRVKTLVSKAYMHAINTIFKKPFNIPPSVDEAYVNKEREDFKKRKIDEVEKEIVKLHTAYISLIKQAANESAPPEHPGSKKNSGAESKDSKNGQTDSSAGGQANGSSPAATTTLVATIPPATGIAVGDSSGTGSSNASATATTSTPLPAAPTPTPKGKGSAPSAPLPGVPKGKQPPAVDTQASKVDEGYTDALSASMTLDYTPPPAAATPPASSKGGGKNPKAPPSTGEQK